MPFLLVFALFVGHVSSAGSTTSTRRAILRIMRAIGGLEGCLFRRAGRRRAEETTLNRDTELGFAGWGEVMSHPATAVIWRGRQRACRRRQGFCLWIFQRAARRRARR